jgi:hypothetical protein
MQAVVETIEGSHWVKHRSQRHVLVEIILYWEQYQYQEQATIVIDVAQRHRVCHLVQLSGYPTF